VTTEQIEGNPETVEVNGEQFQITARHQKYPNGNSEDSIPQRGRKCEESPFEETAEELKANSRGIKGMRGAMWDETSDPYATDVNHSKSAANPGTMTARGGNWASIPLFCRSSSRLWIEAAVRCVDVGMRLVSSVH
jgi:formylglycine-generating enzyme required for sulfatase activity